MSSGKVGALMLALLLVAGIAFGMLFSEYVPAGYMGIVSGINGVEDVALKPGWHIVGPTKRVAEYSTATEQDELSADRERDFDIPTSDGKTINVDAEYSYRFDEESITVLFERFRGKSQSEIEEDFIRGKVKAWAGEISSTYAAMDILGAKRAELNQAAQDHITEQLRQYGIIVDSFNFTRIDVDAETLKVVQQLIDAQQQQELAKIESETALVKANQAKQEALIKAEQERETAAIKAEQQKISAEAEAEAVRIKAEAEAEANREIAASLTSALIEKLKYERWDGSVPQFSGTGITPIVTID